MAVFYMDSFAYTPSDLALRWSHGTLLGSITGRRPNTTAWSSNGLARSFAGKPYLTLGCALKCDAEPPVNLVQIGPLTLSWTGYHFLRVTDGSRIWETTEEFDLTPFRYLEFSLTPSGFQLCIDQISYLSQSYALSPVTNLAFPTFGVYVHDLYLDDEGLMYGDSQVDSFVPTTDGALQEWEVFGATTAHEALVAYDESYVRAGGSNKRCQVRFGTATYNETLIAVQVNVIGRRDELGSRSLRLALGADGLGVIGLTPNDKAYNLVLSYPIWTPEELAQQDATLTTV